MLSPAGLSVVTSLAVGGVLGGQSAWSQAAAFTAGFFAIRRAATARRILHGILAEYG